MPDPARRLSAAALLAALAAPLLPMPASAASAREALGWDAARCGALTVDAGGPPGGRRTELTDWSARLARPGAPGDGAGRFDAQTLSLAGPPALDGLPALLAGALLVGLETHRPSGCDLTHALREAAITLAGLPPGGSAEEHWRGARAAAGRNDVTMATLRLRASHEPGGLTVFEQKATGVSAAGDDMTATPLAETSLVASAPSARIAAIAAGGPLRPDDTVTISRLRIAGDDAFIEASGNLHPASRSGHLVVRARNMEAVRDALPAEERSRAGAALLVMRLAARREDDGTLLWDVSFEDAVVTVNGVPVPVSF